MTSSAESVIRATPRRATPADLPALVELHVHAHGRAGWEPSITATTAHMTDLLTRPHPSFNGADMTVIDDPETGEILSAQHFSTHTWTYAGVPLPVGEIEHVSTRREVRRRGFVRAQIELMHTWAAERGLLMTVINGIPWYYTQFGYELCVEKWCGPSIPRWLIPPLPPGQAEPFRLRPAGDDDLALIGAAYRHGQTEVLLGYRREPAHWRYERERDPANPWRRELRVIEAASGEAVGMLLLHPAGSRPWPMIDAYELLPGVPWTLVTPSIARALIAEQPDATAIKLGWLGSRHPAIAANLSLFVDDPTTLHGAWYIRIPDLTAFLGRIRPALETRLRASAWSHERGELTIGFYKLGGVRLSYDRGDLAVEPWQPTDMFDGDARFADLIFTQLILGYRSLAELERAFVYRVAVSDRARSLLTTLFTPQRSCILPVY